MSEHKSGLPIFYLLLSFIILFILSFSGISKILAFFKSGADPKQILMLGTEVVNDYYQPVVKWEYPYYNKGRPMETATLKKISRDYVASFYHQFQALKSGNPKGLHDYFTEKPREHMKQLVAWHYDKKQLVSGTTISHHPRLDYYSEDGTIASLTDQVISYQIQSYPDRPAHRFYDTSDYRVMLLLEDNFWRVRHKVKGTFLDWRSRPLSSDTIKKVRISKGKLLVEDQPFYMKGINYYPQSHPWQEMWESFDSIDFEQDFQLLRSMGFNTIRIFVPFKDFGGAQVKGEAIADLLQLMNMADACNLMVVVTLFDFFLGYPVEEWTLSDRHAEKVTKAVRHHPALLAWDLKNEPDLDFEQSGEEEVKAWLQFMAKRIKQFDPSTPITVGWSQPEQLENLKEELDLLSFHFYRDPKELATFMKEKRYEKPLFLGETGSHSFSKWWYPFSRDAEEQMVYYQQIADIISRYRLNYAFWTLYDFVHVPSNVAGRMPWKKGPQKAYGLIDPKNQRKPTFQFMKDFNNRNPSTQ